MMVVPGRERSNRRRMIDRIVASEASKGQLIRVSALLFMKIVMATRVFS